DHALALAPRAGAPRSRTRGGGPRVGSYAGRHLVRRGRRGEGSDRAVWRGAVRPCGVAAVAARRGWLRSRGSAQPGSDAPGTEGRGAGDSARAHTAAGWNVGERPHLRPRQREHVHLPTGARRRGPAAATWLRRHTPDRSHHDVDACGHGEPALSPGAAMKARHYVPLIGFVLPTVVIGYGVVIPRSCIAGINDLTLGFAATILGACVTYVLGLRAVL